MAVGNRTIDLTHDVSCIDIMLKRPGLASCYLIQQGAKAGFIDTGTANSVPQLLDVVKRKRIRQDDVLYIMPTHAHLDHAGGAGQLMQSFPKAKLLVHPRGARHMIDTSKLQAGSETVYGAENFSEMFGELLAVDPARVIEVHDRFTLDFNGRVLQFLDTPGHARHHYCIYDAQSKGVFTGDTFGASYPELNNGIRRFIFPPTTPVQFDPPVWKQTIEKLMSLEPQRVYVTHFGMYTNPEELSLALQQSIDEYVAIAEEFRKEENRLLKISQALMQFSLNSLLDNDCRLPVNEIQGLLSMDMQLNAQGLDHWLGKGNET
jgi:glyoxylase-like metal-dependent hydrolase (beta-lactamase superfamily II)